MKTLTSHNIQRQPWCHWPSGRAAVLRRLVHRLVHDLIPTLIMFILVAWGAVIMTEHIHLAKESRSADLTEGSTPLPLQKETYIPGISLPLHK